MNQWINLPASISTRIGPVVHVDGGQDGPDSVPHILVGVVDMR